MIQGHKLDMIKSFNKNIQKHKLLGAKDFVFLNVDCNENYGVSHVGKSVECYGLGCTAIEFLLPFNQD
jgi:hypothetical protein